MLYTRIWQVVRDLGVNRIDHGVHATEDKNLCDEIKRRSLALTICPISNGYVVDGSKSEVIAAMLQAGMRVTVNSYDPAYFSGYMNETSHYDHSHRPSLCQHSFHQISPGKTRSK